MEQLSYAQKQRLSYIDFRLMFVGHFSRAEVVAHFKMGLSNATRDINLYKELAGENLVYDNAEKRYFQTSFFKPLFDYDAQKALSQLTHNFSDSIDIMEDVRFPVETPSQLAVPDIHIVSKLTQSALNNKAVSIGYISLDSGPSKRTIVPHTLVNNGLRWHVRAYDMKSHEFRDFVVTRITKAKLLDLAVSESQSKMSDNQWLRIVPLELVPHPQNIKHPKAIELDYNMNDGVLYLDVRAAIAGYLLRRLNVDCSDSARLLSPEHQLWLRNSPTLYGIENLHLAAGYEGNRTQLHSLGNIDV
ncbi:WYL domain-containing protein [Vibrio sp. Vb1018]|uniref:WYL domain-containing protein n=1 Tax=Vibrio sp. Vb1018 TaxID=3074636 RepID=UPI0029650207|nr:WYL domain-containing protein [Vibrio sp. Vb1018]MDW1819249.1 WYL domain-containing protein [Vibrio sp. Vb1018]